MAKLSARGCTTLVKLISPKVRLRDEDSYMVRDVYAIRSDGWILRQETFFWDGDSKPSRQGWKLWKRIKKECLASFTERMIEKHKNREGWTVKR